MRSRWEQLQCCFLLGRLEEVNPEGTVVLSCKTTGVLCTSSRGGHSKGVECYKRRHSVAFAYVKSWSVGVKAEAKSESRDVAYKRTWPLIQWGLRRQRFDKSNFFGQASVCACGIDSAATICLLHSSNGGLKIPSMCSKPRGIHCKFSGQNTCQ